MFNSDARIQISSLESSQVFPEDLCQMLPYFTIKHPDLLPPGGGLSMKSQLHQLSLQAGYPELAPHATHRNHPPRSLYDLYVLYIVTSVFIAFFGNVASAVW